MEIIKVKNFGTAGAKLIFEGSWCLVQNSLRTWNFTEDFQNLTTSIFELKACQKRGNCSSLDVKYGMPKCDMNPVHCVWDLFVDCRSNIFC